MFPVNAINKRCDLSVFIINEHWNNLTPDWLINCPRQLIIENSFTCCCNALTSRLGTQRLIESLIICNCNFCNYNLYFLLFAYLVQELLDWKYRINRKYCLWNIWLSVFILNPWQPSSFFSPFHREEGLCVRLNGGWQPSFAQKGLSKCATRTCGLHQTVKSVPGRKIDGW